MVSSTVEQAGKLQCVWPVMFRTFWRSIIRWNEGRLLIVRENTQPLAKSFVFSGWLSSLFASLFPYKYIYIYHHHRHNHQQKQQPLQVFTAGERPFSIPSIPVDVLFSVTCYQKTPLSHLSIFSSFPNAFIIQWEPFYQSFSYIGYPWFFLFLFRPHPHGV